MRDFTVYQAINVKITISIACLATVSLYNTL